MAFKVLLTQSARKDILFAMDWYDEQHQNLGYKFYKDYAEVREYPQFKSVYVS